MVRPRFIVDTIGKLHEQLEILSTEVQPSLGPSEVEAYVLTQIALGILPTMPPPVGGGFEDPELDWRRAYAYEPRERVDLLVQGEADGGIASSPRERVYGGLRLTPHDDQGIDHTEHRRGDVVWMNRHERDGVEL